MELRMKTAEERYAELTALVEKMRAELPPMVERETVIELVLEAMSSSIDGANEAIASLAAQLAELQKGVKTVAAAVESAPVPTHDGPLTPQ